MVNIRSVKKAKEYFKFVNFAKYFIPVFAMVLIRDNR